MSLTTDTVSATSSPQLMRGSELGRLSSPRILEVVTHRLGAAHVSIEIVFPMQVSLPARNSIPLHASQNFLRRWNEMRGDAAPCLGSPSAGVQELVPEALELDTGRIELDARSHYCSYCLGIDSEEGFYVLSVRDAHRGSHEAVATEGLTDCLDALGHAANTAITIRRAQQKLVLEILDSGGTAAMVLDGEGWVKSSNTTAHKLLGYVLHLPDRSGDRGWRYTAESADDPLPLERARIKQWPFTTPTGRQLMIYATPWKREDACFRSGDELLVAWDTSLDAPLLNGSTISDSAAMSYALQQTFGLTKTESVLATHLIGADLRTAAQQCGMAYETARSHLKSIFARIKIRRQGELVALLSRFAYHERLRQTLSST